MKLLICIIVLVLVGTAAGQEPAASPQSAPASTPQEKQKNATSATQDNSGISGDQVTKPAGAKGTALIGCLSGPDSDGNYMLRSMQYRTGVQVLGPDDLKKSVGDKVKLTGTWQPLSPEIPASKTARRFQATQVEVVSKGCQAPSETTPVSKKKQRQKAESSSQ
jgi:hypothetical protein